MCKKKPIEPRPDHLFNCRSDASLQDVLHSNTGEICETKFAAAREVMCKTSDCGKYPKPVVAQPQPVASTAAPPPTAAAAAKKEPEPKKK